MWRLNELRDKDIPRVYINNKWVPARPVNYQKKYMTFWERIRNAYEVFTCRAEAFKWPMGQ